MGRLSKVKEFLKTDVWKLDRSEFGRRGAKAIKYLQVFLITMKDVSNQKIGLRAVSLAFFSIMSLIPCVALAFAVTDGFGLAGKLTDLLLRAFPGNGTMIDTISGYANNIVATASQGGFGIVTFLSFIWLVFWLMIQVENAFNYVWKAEKSRNIWQRIGVYIGIVILLPLVVLMFLTTVLLFNDGYGLVSLINIPFWDQISTGLSWLLVYGVTAMVLSLMYKFIPSPKVQYTKALQAAFIAALFFCAFQWLYVTTQVAFNRWNTVFGAVAAIPFLMVWLNISWQIVLIGAEVAYAFQHVDEYKLDRNGKLFADRRAKKGIR